MRKYWPEGKTEKNKVFSKRMIAVSYYAGHRLKYFFRMWYLFGLEGKTEKNKVFSKRMMAVSYYAGHRLKYLRT
jgi:hypothetical protein